MKKNIPDRPPEKARSDAVFAEAAKKAEKLSKKVLTSGNRIDIINKQSAMAHKNKSEMLLWLSRQSTSLVRTRSPVRIWLAAPKSDDYGIRSRLFSYSGRPPKERTEEIWRYRILQPKAVKILPPLRWSMPPASGRCWTTPLPAYRFWTRSCRSTMRTSITPSPQRIRCTVWP